MMALCKPRLASFARTKAAALLPPPLASASAGRGGLARSASRGGGRVTLVASAVGSTSVRGPATLPPPSLGLCPSRSLPAPADAGGGGRNRGIVRAKCGRLRPRNASGGDPFARWTRRSDRVSSAERHGQRRPHPGRLSQTRPSPAPGREAASRPPRATCDSPPYGPQGLRSERTARQPQAKRPSAIAAASLPTASARVVHSDVRRRTRPALMSPMRPGPL